MCLHNLYYLYYSLHSSVLCEFKLIQDNNVNFTSYSVSRFQISVIPVNDNLNCDCKFDSAITINFD